MRVNVCGVFASRRNASGDAGVGLEPFQHLRVGPSDAAPGVGLRHGLPVLPASRPRVGQVVLPRREEPVRDPSVHGAAHVRGEQPGVGRHDRVHGLSLPDGRGERLVHLPYGLVVGMHSRAAVDESARVVRMRGGGDVVALAERTVALLLAAVAHVRRAVQARTAGLDEVWARLEASRRTLPLDVPEPVEGGPPASVEEGAEPVRAAVPLVAVDAAREQFAGDGRFRPPQRPCDVRHLVPAAEQELDAASFVLSHVFHGLSPCCRLRIRRHGTCRDACPGWRNDTPKQTSPKVNASFPPRREGEDFRFSSMKANLYGG